MNIDVRSLDIMKQLQQTPAGDTPIAIVKRFIGDNYAPGKQATHPVDKGIWHILQDEIPNEADEYNWSRDLGGTVIRVPMVPYILNDPSPEALMRFGTQLGVLVTHLGHENPGIGPLRTVLILLSNVFSRLDGQPGSMVYVGTALREK